MSRYSKNREYDMREEATPCPSSAALAAPTLPKAGSAATLAARALQHQYTMSAACTCCQQMLKAQVTAYVCIKFLRVVDLSLSPCTKQVFLATSASRREDKSKTARGQTEQQISRHLRATYRASLYRCQVSHCPCMLACVDRSTQPTARLW